MHTSRLGLLFRLEFGMKMTLGEKVKDSSCPTVKLGVPGVCGRGLGGRQGHAQLLSQGGFVFRN